MLNPMTDISFPGASDRKDRRPFPARITLLIHGGGDGLNSKSPAALTFASSFGLFRPILHSANPQES